MIKAVFKYGIGTAFLVLLIVSCVAVKPNALYIDTDKDKVVPFYSASEIYADIFSSEAWSTQSEGCIDVNITKEAAFAGSHGIDISWNKTKEGCPWLGFGFGWDNWTGKDLAQIKNIGAIQFHVKLPEGERKTLPWAIGLEDFTGSQAWLGITSNTVKAQTISSTEWVRIEMPLAEFNWDEQDADASNIKQIIFNTEADGRVFIDEIKIVPYSGGFRKRATLETLLPSQFSVDGKMDDDIWKTEAQKFGDNEVHLALVDTFLCIAAKVKDSSPLQNNFKGKDIYNGDAFELAFSTNPDARKRTNYLSTDQQIGFALSEYGIKSWDWRESKELSYKNFKATATDDGYVFEAMVRLSDLDVSSFELGRLYGLEIAVDHGTTVGRDNQQRWNDQAGGAAFYENPSLWGEMYFLTKQQMLNRK